MIRFVEQPGVVLNKVEGKSNRSGHRAIANQSYPVNPMQTHLVCNIPAYDGPLLNSKALIKVMISVRSGGKCSEFQTFHYFDHKLRIEGMVNPFGVWTYGNGLFGGQQLSPR